MNDFFATFVEVLADQAGPAVFVEPDTISADYLSGFLLGARQALSEARRVSPCVTVKEVSPFTIGVLMALYERAVGLYATLININAYNQPGVEAGKRAAANVLSLQKRIVEHLSANKGNRFTAATLGRAIGGEDQTEHVFKICQRLSANPSRKILKTTKQACYEAQFEAI